MPASTADRRAVVRADASAAIGLGHVTRSIALADELARAGWTVTLCGAGVPPAACPAAVEQVEATPQPDPGPVLALDPDLVVVDGYHFTASFFSALDDAAVPYAVVDDDGTTPALRPVAVVNQNPHADRAMYRHLPGDPLLLLGIEHCLLRREVVAAAERPPRARSSSVMVAFGGSDPRNLTVSVGRALASAGHDVRAAIGPAHPDRTGAQEALSEGGVTVVPSGDYVAELASAGVAVLGAGSSLWEAACLRTPAIAVVVAPNQRRPAAAALEQGLVAGLLDADGGPPADVVAGIVSLVGSVCAAPPTRAGSLRPSPDGARRVARALGELVADPILRAATLDDADFLLALRIDPDVDRQSFGPAPTVAEHRVWLDRVLADPARRLYLVEDGAGRPVGQLRLDADPVVGAETVSIALVAGMRGRGLARRALRAAQRLATGDLTARVRRDNAASVAAFSSVGFACESSAGGEVRMRWRRDGADSGEPT